MHFFIFSFLFIFIYKFKVTSKKNKCIEMAVCQFSSEVGKKNPVELNTLSASTLEERIVKSA